MARYPVTVSRQLLVRLVGAEKLAVADSKLEMLHQMASEINKPKRQSYLNFAVNISGNTEIIWQATSCRKLFKNGFLRPTHGKITKSPVNRATRRRGHGSLKAKLSQNGNPLDQVLFC